VELARQKASATGQAAAKAFRLTHELKSLATRGKGQLTDSTNRLLELFTPQI
jgi:hypothetical protein